MVTSPPIAPPANAVVVLLDSLNRHLLGATAAPSSPRRTSIGSPRTSVRFTNHYTGSLPCMPARHDILCGALDFLWKPWGSIELWEDAVTVRAASRRASPRCSSPTTRTCSRPAARTTTPTSRRGTTSAATRATRGGPVPTRPGCGAPVFGFCPRRATYDRSRGWFRRRGRLPRAAHDGRAPRSWLDENARTARPVPALRRRVRSARAVRHARAVRVAATTPTGRDRTSSGRRTRSARSTEGDMTERQGRQVRAQLRRQALDDRPLVRARARRARPQRPRDTTAVIVCTDHGHYLGENDVGWGKPGVPVYEPLGHIPLLVRVAGRRRRRLRRAHDERRPVRHDRRRVRRRAAAPHARSLARAAARGEATSIRDWALTGVWGREVHSSIAERPSTRAAPVGDNAPLSMWSNRWSTMPTHALSRRDELPLPDDRAVLDRMPGSTSR